MTGGKWDARIRRARDLASTYPFAKEGLQFYEQVAAAQKSLYSKIETACGSARIPRSPGSLREELDSFAVLPHFGSFLSLIQQIAPTPLCQSANELAAQGAVGWNEVLNRFWETGLGSPTNLKPAEALISWIFLQPYAEYLANHSEWTIPFGTPNICPFCGSKPQVGVLRPEGDGGKRSLTCGLCALEWEYRRIVCPACGEEDVHKLAVYSTQEFGHVRAEACDSCRTYIKTIDLTKDGLAIPVVDELATVPLDLWAGEHGYTKLQSNILGI